MNCLLSNFIIFPNFRQPGRQIGSTSANWHEYWSLQKVVLFLIHSQEASQFQLCQSELLLFGIGYIMRQGLTPAPKILNLRFVLKNLAILALNLSCLMYSSWWTPSPGCLLVWCSRGSAWSVGPVGLYWLSNRVYLNVVSHQVLCHPSILVVY